jgi:hypothetical protein
MSRIYSDIEGLIEEEDWNLAFLLPPDFPLDDVLKIVDLLAEADVCVPGYFPPAVGMYHPVGHFYERQMEGVETTLIPDRNVASRIAQLAQGITVRDDDQLRIAAALLAFAQCMDMEIEPAIAFHELAHKEGNDTAWCELAWFRAADNVSPVGMIDIALQRRDALTGIDKRPEVGSADLAKPIKRWRRNYIIALKMAELEQLKVRPVDRVLSLFDWMRRDFIFGGPAALLASVYFAPKSPPKRHVFKNKNSVDREAAIAGVRNAAWDLTHLSDFVRRVNEEGRNGKRRYLFASFDRHLRQMAKLMFKFGTKCSPPDALSGALSEWWTRSDAERIVTSLLDHIEHVRSPEWKPKTASRPDFIDELISNGERRVREVSEARRS